MQGWQSVLELGIGGMELGGAALPSLGCKIELGWRRSLARSGELSLALPLLPVVPGIELGLAALLQFLRIELGPAALRDDIRRVELGAAALLWDKPN